MVNDYIIVGAGAAGSLVAARLSEIRQWNVLLVEAGKADPGPDARVPIAWRQQLGGSNDWGLTTEPEPYLNGRQLSYPQGKCVGGSTALYAGIYSPGDPYDYDAWRELGNAGWGWDYVSPYFGKSREKGLPVETPRWIHPATKAFLEAGGDDGVHVFPRIQKQGKKLTAADIFLKPVQAERPNLTVVSDVLVVRVLMDGERAKGIEVIRNGKIETMEARVEVILCAGALETPAILMRSGIGPQGHLENVGIETLLHLPGVGENLQEHVRAGIEFSNDRFEPLERQPGFWKQVQYWLKATGPMSSGVVEAGAYWRSGEEQPAPDLQLNFVPRRQTGRGYALWVALLRPFSRGYVRLRSGDPGEGPAIHLNVLEEREDRQRLELGLERARRLGAKMGQLEEGVQYDVMWHACGTCRMGEDRMGVVDTNLKVHGTRGLRIVDASVMPLIPSGNTAAPTLMVAERGADLIRC